MRYLIIKNDLDPLVTGIKQGITQGKIDKRVFNGKEWLEHFLYRNNAGLRRGDFPESDFELEGLWLDRKSNFTDFISIGGLRCGFIISEKVMNILASRSLPKSKFYKVSFNRPSQNYYWFYYNLFDGKHQVNFIESRFDVEAAEKELGDKITIKSFDDYIKYLNILGRGIVPTKIVFNKNFASNIDFFGMRFLGNANYISEDLNKIFIKEGVIGFKTASPPLNPALEWEHRMEEY